MTTPNNTWHCPVCAKHALHAAPSGPTSPLPSFRCAHCAGQWIRGEHYYHWIENADRSQASSSDVRDVPAAHDQPRAKLCPECGKIMRRYAVGHGVDFAIDRCGTCAGIWFDANEWEQLQAHDLADRVHFVFSAAWQAELQKQRRDEAEQARLKQRLGENDFAELMRLKEWIDRHPHRSEVTAFLLDTFRHQQA